MTQVEKKRKFIRAWYINECSKLSFGDSLKLARIWIVICINDEEYEMASTIEEEKKRIIQKHIKEKRRRRSFSQKAIIAIYLWRRKFLTWIKSKLSK